MDGAAKTILNDYLRVIYLLHAEAASDPGSKRLYLEAAKPRDSASFR